MFVLLWIYVISLNGQHSGEVRAVAFQQKVASLNPGQVPFWVEFTHSLYICVGFRQVLWVTFICKFEADTYVFFSYFCSISFIYFLNIVLFVLIFCCFFLKQN